MGTGRTAFGGCGGAQTAGLAFGGLSYPPPVTQNITEEYDGSSWTAGGNLNTARFQISGSGIQTSALAFGGNTPPTEAITEEYNGSAWTTGANMNVRRVYVGGAGDSNTAGLAFGGNLPDGSKFDSTEKYDGTAWKTTTPMLNETRDTAGCGVQTAALAVGGFTPLSATSTETEEFSSVPGIVAEIITTT